MRAPGWLRIKKRNATGQSLVGIKKPSWWANPFTYKRRLAGWQQQLHQKYQEKMQAIKEMQRAFEQARFGDIAKETSNAAGAVFEQAAKRTLAKQLGAGASKIIDRGANVIRKSTELRQLFFTLPSPIKEIERVGKNQFRFFADVEGNTITALIRGYDTKFGRDATSGRFVIPQASPVAAQLENLFKATGKTRFLNERELFELRRAYRERASAMIPREVGATA